MTVLETVASFFNWILECFAYTAYAVLNVNYYIMTVLTGFIIEATNNVSSALQATFHLLHCYLTDFCTFLQEFVAVLCVIISYVKYVAWSLYEAFLYLTYTLFIILNFLYSVLLITGASIHYAASHIVSAFAYLLNLIFSALILLLLLLPNAIMYVYDILLRGAISSMLYFQILLNHLKNSLIGTAQGIKIVSIDIFDSIPPKAYVGLLLLVILYYKRKPVAWFSRKFCLLLMSVLIGIVRVINLHIYATLSLLLGLFAKPFLWILQLMPKRNSAVSAESDRNLQAQGYVSVIYSKLSLIGTFCKAVLMAFRFSKSTSINIKDPDQIIHLRYLEQKLNEERDRHLCVVCQDELRTMLLLPCRHLCLCSSCWQSLQIQGTDCPVCRRNVYEALHVFV